MNYVVRSIILDIQFFLLDLTLSEKIEFIFIKYLILCKNLLLGYKVGNSYAVIFGQKYYYDDKFGISYLQSLYIDNAFLKNYIKPASTVIDIGANIGQFNFFCRHYLNAKEIYSFEPVCATFELLSKNINNNIFPYAISTKKNDNFYIPVTSLMASKYKLSSSDKKEKIRGINLDIFLKVFNIPHINLFKIDTEGSEYDVMVNSKNTIKKSRYILLETSVERQSSGDILESIVLLKKFLPHIHLAKVGRIFQENTKTVAIDLLFKQNNKL